MESRQERLRYEEEKQRIEQERKKRNFVRKVTIPTLTVLIIVVSVIVIFNPFNPHHAELQPTLIGKALGSICKSRYRHDRLTVFLVPYL
jgi:hypothetical protein